MFSPLERSRVEKAAADCGFEMTPVADGANIVLMSTAFPESVSIARSSEGKFLLTASQSILLPDANGGTFATAGDYDGLYALLQKASAIARTMPNRVADRYRARVAHMPASTDAERLVVQRVGQNLFRDALLDYWQGVCCVTGLAVPELLRASHIKPWAQCASDNERLDVFNGLLLAPHVDALFDGGWITFAPSGEIIVSPALPATARERLGVSLQWQLKSINERQAVYLKHHRAVVFRG